MRNYCPTPEKWALILASTRLYAVFLAAMVFSLYSFFLSLASFFLEFFHQITVIVNNLQMVFILFSFEDFLHSHSEDIVGNRVNLHSGEDFRRPGSCFQEFL